MAQTERSPRSIAGPILLLIILLVDVGLVIVAWHMRRQRQMDYGNFGLDLSSPPNPAPALNAAPTAAAALPQPEEPAIIPGTLSSVVPEDLGPGPRGAAASPASAAGLGQAKSVFDKVKNEPRFRNSKILREWKRDFLAYPDLAGINSRYQKDRNIAAFLKSMVRSGNFRRMFRKYIGTPDMQAFLKTLAFKPPILSAAKSLSSDGEIQKTLRKVDIPGLPSYEGFADIGRARAGAAPRRDSSEALRRAKENPALKNMLDEQELSGETLRSAETGRKK
ncbi:MAG: hypothetical protein WCU88_05170 [Elusimicrobiota bacterium]|jgi:hypothetical protein